MASRKRDYSRKKKVRPHNPLCIIVAEDSVTGAVSYLRAFKTVSNSNFTFKNIDQTDPKKLVESTKNYLKNKKKGFGDTAGDTLWVVCDVDQNNNSQLGEVATLCQGYGYSLIVSNPCFELWELYHQQSCHNRPFQNSQECKSAGKNFSLELTQKNVQYAIEHAKKIDCEQGYPTFPTCQGSHMYKLVEFLLKQQKKN